MCHRGYSKALPTPSVLVNLSALLLRMKNWTKPRWIHPADESIPLKDSCQPILLFFFFPFFLVGVSPLHPWAQPVVLSSCWLGMLREGAGWSWGAISTVGACLHRAQHTGAAGSGQSTSLPSPLWSLLQSFPSFTHKSSIPLFCSSPWLHVRVQQQQN